MTWPIRVSNHALEQAGEPGVGADRDRIVEGVEQAIAAGRLSVHRTLWLEPRRARGLYAGWSGQATAFVLIAEADHFIFVTTLTAASEEAA